MRYLGFVILLCVVLGCAGRSLRSIEQKPVAKASPKPNISVPEPELQADVELTTIGVKVTNTDSSDFGSLTLKLNLKNLGSDDGRASVGGLAKGKSMVIPYGEFTTGTTRFKIGDTKILTVFVKTSGGMSKLFLCPGSKCQPA